MRRIARGGGSGPGGGRRAATAAVVLSLAWTAGCAPGEGAAQEAGLVPADQGEILERADAARLRGSEDAPVRIVEVSDFECPFCAEHYRTSFAAIDSLYVRPGLVRYLWISFPNSGHSRAWPAIEAAFCAGAAGRFWEMHGLLFRRQDAWSAAGDPNALFRDYAAEIGVDGTSFAACLRNDQPAPLQVADYESAMQSGIRSTPFFVLGDSLAIQGAVPLERFRAALDSVLEARGAQPPR